jgi:hypothetical protein
LKKWFATMWLDSREECTSATYGGALDFTTALMHDYQGRLLSLSIAHPDGTVDFLVQPHHLKMCCSTACLYTAAILNCRSDTARSGVSFAYISTKNVSAASRSVNTASPCRGSFHEKYSATYVLKSSVSSIMSMDARKNLSGLYSRSGTLGSFYSFCSERRG